MDTDGGGTHEATAARDETHTKSINSTVNVRNWTDSVNHTKSINSTVNVRNWADSVNYRTKQ